MLKEGGKALGDPFRPRPSVIFATHVAYERLRMSGLKSVWSDQGLAVVSLSRSTDTCVMMTWRLGSVPQRMPSVNTSKPTLQGMANCVLTTFNVPNKFIL